MVLPEPGYQSVGILRAIGCSLVIAGIVTTVACLATLFDSTVTGEDRFVVIVVVGGVTFGVIVVWVCLQESNSKSSFSALMAKIRFELESRDTVSDEEFVTCFSNSYHILVKSN